jgi:hypothetical protein
MLTSTQMLSPLFAAYRAWPQSGDAGERMKALGHYLIDVASASTADFREFLRDLARPILCQQQVLLEMQAARASGPGGWAADMNAFATARRAQIPYAVDAAPFDLAARSEPGFEALQRICARFGELLSVWSGIVRATRALAARGIVLGEEV